ncbi:MAG: iron ABC transporter permease [Xanthobacteraceae bacterium]|nr:MAG: iron ABC transporter permease [Xanthobacteraceae bacterium]
MSIVRGRRRERSWGITTVVALALATAALVAAPVIAVVALAAQPATELWPHLVAYVLPVALRDTLALLGGVGVVALVIGVGTAWLVSSFDFPLRSLYVWLLPLPLALPTYICAYIYVEIFEPLGVAHMALARTGLDGAAAFLPNVRSLAGAILIVGIVLYPYLFLSARATFQTQSAEFAEAARMLGARPWQVLRHVSWPMARPAIAVGLSLIMLETLNDIGATEYLGVRTLTVSIFTTWLNRGSLAGAAQLACIMLLMVAVLVMIEQYGRRARNVAASAESPRLAERRRLRGSAAAGATLACALPVMAGFVMPVLFLAGEAWHRNIGDLGSLMRDSAHSVVYALSGTAIALILGPCIALAHRWRPQRWLAHLLMIAGTGYALPGTVLALGLLSPLVAVDEALNAVSRAFGGPALGLVIAGSGAAIVIAYVIRFVAVTSGFAQAGFARIPHEYDDSVRITGARTQAGLRRVYLPLLEPSIWGAAIVVFVDCLKELPATLLLRPLNVETLATSIYQYASRGSFEDGALAALIIVAVGIVPVVLLARLSDSHARAADKEEAPQAATKFSSSYASATV